MATQQDLDMAIEEFGDDAYKRFLWLDYDNQWCEFNSNVELSVMFDELYGARHDIETELKFKPLPDLFAHDIEVYGDNAYLMWEFDFFNRGEFMPCSNNECVKDLIYSWCITTDSWLLETKQEVRRKTSAELPFNLECAKTGDVVERIDLTGKWVVETSWFHTAFIHNDIVIYGEHKLSAKLKDLRMKYPPRIKKA